MKRFAGFTFLEVIATIAVIGVLAAALVPSIVGYQTRKGVETTVAIAKEIQAAMVTMKNSASNKRYPSLISHLGAPITTSDLTSCSGYGFPSKTSTTATLYTSADVTGWTATPTGGPYFHRAVPITGFPTPMGIMSDTVYRAGTNTGSGPLLLYIRDALYDQANDFNAVFEGDANNADGSNTLGNVRFGVAVNGLVDVEIRMTAATSC